MHGLREKKKLEKQFESTQRHNSMEDLTFAMIGDSGKSIDSQLSLSVNSVHNFITLNRSVLALQYMHNPIVNIAISKPVQDALRGGIIIDCEDLGSDVELIIKRLQKRKVFKVIEEAFIWARLFGGSAIVIDTQNGYTEDNEISSPLRLKDIDDITEINYYALDRWQIQNKARQRPDEFFQIQSSEFWNVGGQQVHNSRFIIIHGKPVPSLFRANFQGWGVSEVEKMVRSINTYQKAENVIFELKDEAKVDIFKIEGLGDSFANPSATENMIKRVQFSQMQKNYQNALILDKEDDFESKHINFSGLRDINSDSRASIAMSSEIPQDKFWGEGASGFSSGEDTLEGYAYLVERERTRMIPVFEDIIKIEMKSLFGRVFDFKVEFHSLKIMNSLTEEQVKMSKLNRIISMKNNGMVTDEQVQDFLIKNSLIGV